jgi:hypothetical protein
MTKMRSAVGNVCCGKRIKVDDAVKGQLLNSEGHVIVGLVTSHQQDKYIIEALDTSHNNRILLADGGSHVTSAGYSPMVSKERDSSCEQQQVPTHS